MARDWREAYHASMETACFDEQFADLRKVSDNLSVGGRYIAATFLL